jgi:tetratricopeptide (TPR) repeat protein
MVGSLPRLWQRARRPLGWAALGIGLLLVLWAGHIGWHARQIALQIEALRNEATATPTTASAESLCAHTRAIAGSIAALDFDLHPLRGVLPALGWVPQYGPTLTQAPALLDAASAGGEIGRSLCHGFAPAFPLLDARQQGASSEELLVRALPALEGALPDLEVTAAALARLEAALARTDIDRLAGGPLASRLPLLRSARDQLPDARAAFDTVRSLIPIAVQMLQPGAPRRYLLLAQNSGELRATGGYIGTLGTVLVSNGRAQLESFSDTYDLNVIAPPEMEMPISYVRYLRISEWYLRDANWHADFPTSARTLQYFWSLNKRPPLDGVIGIDLFAFQQFLAALGPLEVAEYGLVRADTGLEPLFALYKARDKRLLGALLDTALLRLQQLTPDQGLALVRAIDRALVERHILLVLNDPETQAMIHARNWDGALVKTDGDYLMVAESDFGYSEINLFIDSRITYSVTLASDLRPLTATVTIENSNGFDLWKQGHTDELIGGLCEQGFVTKGYYRGCYRDFVRVYARPTAIWLGDRGLDGHDEYALEQDYAMFANYMLLVPGELRFATMSYRPEVPSSDGTYRLYVQKQPGTLARPLRVDIRTNTGQTLTLDTDLWTDREFVVGWQNGHLALLSELGPLHPTNLPEQLAPRAAFVAGWAQWQDGRREQAIETWRAGRAVESVIDQANMLTVTGNFEAARAVAAAATRLDPQSARAAFALGQAAIGGKQWRQAFYAFQRSIELDPANPQTRLALDVLRLQGAPTK